MKKQSNNQENLITGGSGTGAKPQTTSLNTTSKFKDGSVNLVQENGLEITFDSKNRPGVSSKCQKFRFIGCKTNPDGTSYLYTLEYVPTKKGHESLELRSDFSGIVTVKVIELREQQQGDLAPTKDSPSGKACATTNDQSDDNSELITAEAPLSLDTALGLDTASDEAASPASELDTATPSTEKSPTITELLKTYEVGKEADAEYLNQVVKALDNHSEGSEIEVKDIWPLSLLWALFGKHRKSFDRLPENVAQFVVDQFQKEVQAPEPDQEILRRAAEMARDKTALVSGLPEMFQGLVAAWEALPYGGERGQDYNAGRRTIAKKLAAILNTEDQTELRVIDKVLKKYAAEGTGDNPLYIIIFEELSMLMNEQATTKNVRKVAMRFDRDTLIGLVACLKNGSIPKNQGVLPPLLDILSETFAQEFYSLRENGKMAQYQNLGNALFDLVMMMDTEAQEPYFWRLFSYMREAWSHIAHNIKPGANESGGARGYLGWLLDKIPQFPDKKMQELFVLSLMIGNTQFEASSEGELVKFLVDYVWQASGDDRQSRRMRIDNAIPAGTALHYKFLNSYSYKGQQEAG